MVARSGKWATLRQEIDVARNELGVAHARPNQQMCKFLILGEDHRFGSHPGVDGLALCRAAWRTYVCGRREGGSTIAMQFVRVLTGKYEKSWQRKTEEIALAICVTRYVPPAELPSLYLSVGYYGWRMNGFVQACGRLRIDPFSCSLRESAMIVARLKYPQPRVCSAERLRQITQRTEYLIARLESHGKRN